MSKIPRIGFIGFGEAGYHLAKGLRQAGIEQISAFDTADTPLIRQRAQELTGLLQSSNADLAAHSDIIFSTVTANQAATAAEQTAPFLETRHLYADLNSVSPGLKQALAKTVEAAGARFVEVAVMSAVPPHGHKVPMLTGGVAAAEFAERLSPFGMVIEVGSAQVGSAAATKMCRSIMIKGIEALLTECVLGATRYGADERVFSSLGESLPGIDWAKLATYMVGRVVMHGERRAREMEEVAETLTLRRRRAHHGGSHRPPHGLECANGIESPLWRKRSAELSGVRRSCLRAKRDLESPAAGTAPPVT